MNSPNIIYIGIISLCDDTLFGFNLSATQHFKQYKTTANFPLVNRTSQTRCLTLRRGEFLLFRSEVAHFGASQQNENYRVHCVLQSPFSNDKVSHGNTYFFIPDEIPEEDEELPITKKRKNNTTKFSYVYFKRKPVY